MPSTTWNSFLGVQRLGDVIVHAGRQAPLPVPLHRVRRHRHDRNVAPRRPLQTPDGRRRLEPVHLRHLHVHQHQVERRPADRLERLDPRGGDRDGVPALLQEAHRELLVDHVVLGQEDAQGAFVGGRDRHRRDAADQVERVEQGRQQVGLLDRLDEGGADAQFAAPGQRRRAWPAEVSMTNRVVPARAGTAAAPRHASVEAVHRPASWASEQQERVRLPRLAVRRLQLRQGERGALDGRGPSCASRPARPRGGGGSSRGRPRRGCGSPASDARRVARHDVGRRGRASGQSLALNVERRCRTSGSLVHGEAPRP